MLNVKHCTGCRDNFYNGRNPYGVQECWMRRDAKLVTRFETGTWTMPESPGAFTEVRVPNCYHKSGSHYSDRLPSFVKRENVNWRRKRAREE